MVGRWALANHGRDLTHQGAARIRPAGADYRDVFVSRRWVERAWTAAIAWRARRTNQMDHQPQSMVLQLAHGHRGRDGLCRLLHALRNFAAANRSNYRPADGLSRKRRALLRAVRPSRTDLPVCVRNLRPDGAVVGIFAGGACTCASPASHRRGPGTKRPLCTGLFLVGIHLFYCFGFAPKLLHSSDPSSRRDSRGACPKRAPGNTHGVVAAAVEAWLRDYCWRCRRLRARLPPATLDLAGAVGTVADGARPGGVRDLLDHIDSRAVIRTKELQLGADRSFGRRRCVSFHGLLLCLCDAVRRCVPRRETFRP